MSKEDVGIGPNDIYGQRLVEGMLYEHDWNGKWVLIGFYKGAIHRNLPSGDRGDPGGYFEFHPSPWPRVGCGSELMAGRIRLSPRNDWLQDNVKEVVCKCGRGLSYQAELSIDAEFDCPDEVERVLPDMETGGIRPSTEESLSESILKGYDANADPINPVPESSLSESDQSWIDEGNHYDFQEGKMKPGIDPEVDWQDEALKWLREANQTLKRLHRPGSREGRKGIWTKAFFSADGEFDDALRVADKSVDAYDTRWGKNGTKLLGIELDGPGGGRQTEPVRTTTKRSLYKVEIPEDAGVYWISARNEAEALGVFMMTAQRLWPLLSGGLAKGAWTGEWSVSTGDLLHARTVMAGKNLKNGVWGSSMTIWDKHLASEGPEVLGYSDQS